MTETEVTQAAREAAAQVHPYSHNSALILDGQRDGTDIVRAAAIAIHRTQSAAQNVPVGKYHLGDRVTKTKGSNWTGLVVGFYSTSLTPIGYAVESETERGSVQIYPESALSIAQAQEPE